MQFEKYINEDGKVAVLVSPGYGAGWSTWASSDEREAAKFDRRIVEQVLAKNDDLERFVQQLGYTSYTGGLSSLEIEWVAPGEPFYIHEYDGYEDIRWRDSDGWTVA